MPHTVEVEGIGTPFDLIAGADGTAFTFEQFTGQPGDVITITATSGTQMDTATFTITGTATPPAITILEDSALSVEQSTGADTDGDGQIDQVMVGTQGGVTVHGVAPIDNDSGDSEVIAADPLRAPSASSSLDLDGDGDSDLIIVGTQGVTFTGVPGAKDDDPNDTEVIAFDETLFPSQSFGVDLDDDGDADVWVNGTYALPVPVG